MEREILFRGKRVDNSEWVYGDLSQYKDVPTSNIDFYCIDTMPIEKDFGHTHKVDKNTIGQFTGLTDNNGIKIFENDIVEIETEIGNREIKDFWKDVQVRQGYAYDYKVRIDQAIVQWNSKKGMWDLKVYNNGRYKRKAKLFVYRHNGCKVIGNIYDNLELLGEIK